MPTLLNIQSSPRGVDSVSRTLSQEFVAAWQKKHPEGKIILRDLAESHLPYVGVPWITGIFLTADRHTAEMREALRVSDELIAEIFAADEILIGTPMYNFTVPANLKAWIDLVVRPRVTHSGPPDRKGLVLGKSCKIIVASGGVYTDGMPSAASDYESGYLKRILGFIGITNAEVILAGGTAVISFGSTSVQELVERFRPAVLAAV